MGPRVCKLGTCISSSGGCSGRLGGEGRNHSITGVGDQEGGLCLTTEL